ncbi:MAG: hypothetical protein K2W96_08195 [Gemmataceae bacterium]|nr:hypothetical protein [Gemmataceae bacterium]
MFFFQRVREAIADIERNAGHDRTLVVGDFNTNPFEPEIESALGLHAISTPRVGTADFRSISHQDYPFFYNPMWGCYARQDRPRASYYFNGSDFHEHFWHMLDQVVLRPSLLPSFPERRLRILDSAGGTSLVTTSGLPDRAGASDHLPMLFHVNHLRRSAHA